MGHTRIEDLLAFDLAARHETPDGSITATEPRLLEPIGERLRDLAGFDEAGRGALAGPVTVACVSFPGFHRPDMAANLANGLAGLDDSKRLTARCRERLEPIIQASAFWAVGWASAREVDGFGIVPACRLAAARALARLGHPVELFLFDRGLSLPENTAVERRSFARLELTGGDALSAHIAAASVLAKVARDRMMVGLAERFPGYDLDCHKGYGTKAHRDAIRRLGPSWLHRRSFASGKSAQSQSC